MEDAGVFMKAKPSSFPSGEVQPKNGLRSTRQDVGIGDSLRVESRVTLILVQKNIGLEPEKR
jgi:hypothetical protein